MALIGGGRVRRVALATALAALGASALAAPARATIFDPGEKIGNFKVLGGHLDQKVSYLANYRSVTGDDCYYLNWSDKGASAYNLSFDKGERESLRFRQGMVRFFPLPGRGGGQLDVSGRVSRSYSGSMRAEAGPQYHESRCGPPPPPPEGVERCGSKTVRGVPASLGLVPFTGGRFSPGGRDAALFGVLFQREPLPNCPSTSSYARIPFDAASQNGMKKLDEAKSGEAVTLDGKEKEIVRGPEGFFWPFGDWVSGSQTVSIDWQLKLKRLKGN
jgi:hypothetical protein